MRDIEELAELGKQEGTCSYYGARKAAALAQVRDVRVICGVVFGGDV